MKRRLGPRLRVKRQEYGHGGQEGGVQGRMHVYNCRLTRSSRCINLGIHSLRLPVDVTQGSVLRSLPSDHDNLLHAIVVDFSNAVKPSDRPQLHPPHLNGFIPKCWFRLRTRRPFRFSFEFSCTNYMQYCFLYMLDQRSVLYRL